MEDGQEHGHHDTADDDTEEGDEERFHEGGERFDQGVYFGIIEIGDFDQHAVDVAGLLTGTAHVFDHGGEVGVLRDHLRNLPPLADMLGNVFAGALHKGVAGGGGDDVERLENRHTRTHQDGIGAAEAGQVHLAREFTDDRELRDQIVLNDFAPGGGDETFDQPGG